MSDWEWARREIPEPPDYARPTRRDDLMGRLVGAGFVAFCMGAATFALASLAKLAAGSPYFWPLFLLAAACGSYGVLMVGKAWTVETSWQRYDRLREESRERSTGAP